MEIRSLSFPPNPVHGQEYDHKGRRYYYSALTGAWLQTTTPTLSPFPVPAREQWIALTAAYTLVSQTAAQSMFPTGGLVMAANRTYFFECQFALTSMSGSAADFGFALAGTATITRQRWWSAAKRVNTPTTPTGLAGTSNTAASTTLDGANSQTAGEAFINGILRIGAGGTIIPQVSLGAAAAAIVGIDSFFKIRAVGIDTAQSSDT